MKKVTTVRATAKTIDALDKIAKQDKRSRAAVIEIALESYVESRRMEMKK
jgi:predicted transcriptional regulator